MSYSASRSADASVSDSSRLPSTIEKSHLAGDGSDSNISSNCDLSVQGGGHSMESPDTQPARHTAAPLQDHLVHTASLAGNDDSLRRPVHQQILDPPLGGELNR